MSVLYKYGGGGSNKQAMYVRRVQSNGRKAKDVKKSANHGRKKSAKQWI